MPRATLPCLAAVLALGCAAPPPRLLTGPGPALNIGDWLAANPIGPGEDVKAVPVARTPSSSLAIVQVRTRERPHAHEFHDLTVHVLSGTGRMVLASAPGGTVFTVTARPIRGGDTVVISRGTIHWFESAGGTPAVALAAFSPPFNGQDTAITPLMNAIGEFVGGLRGNPAVHAAGTIEVRADGSVIALGRRLPEPR